MKKRIELIFPKNDHHVYLGINISRRLQVSGLLKRIKAEELVECNHFSKHAKLNNSYKKSGKLEDRKLYLVHTNNLDRTLDLIKNYKNQQQ